MRRGSRLAPANTLDYTCVMSRSLDETSRDFLIRLARTATFVAPVVATLDAAPAAGQGKGSSTSAGKGKAVGQQRAAVGSLTPASGAAVNQQLRIQSDPDQTVPWAPGSGEVAPWTVPPPTSTG